MTDKPFRIDEVLTYLKQSESGFLEELAEFVSIESVGADPARRDDMRAAAEWLSRNLAMAGMHSATVHETPLNPIVTASYLPEGGAPTFLLYGHYDVQPADPVDQWLSPPFEMTTRDGRIWGRGTTDDKGQTFMHVKVAEAFLATHGTLPIGLRVLVEGEEEIGSPSLPAFLEAHRSDLDASLVIVSDTPMFAAGMPAIGYGLRGLAYLEVRVDGAGTDLHSGQFGGSVPNPANALVQVLASLHDGNGRVAVPGFYDSVVDVPEEERLAIRALPFDEEAYATSLGVTALPGEHGYSALERVWIRPTLDVNGLFGGYSGPGSKTVIPASAGAKLSCRLVPNQRFEDIADRVAAHLRAVAPPGVKVEVSVLHGGQPAVLPVGHPAAVAAAAAIRDSFGREPIFERDGGTIPAVAHLDEILGLKSLLLPFGVPDENKHAPNEFLDLANFRQGMDAIARLWIRLGAAQYQETQEAARGATAQ